MDSDARGDAQQARGAADGSTNRATTPATAAMAPARNVAETGGEPGGRADVPVLIAPVAIRTATPSEPPISWPVVFKPEHARLVVGGAGEH
jgi:hypothetical protein